MCTTNVHLFGYIVRYFIQNPRWKVLLCMLSKQLQIIKGQLPKFNTVETTFYNRSHLWSFMSVSFLSVYFDDLFIMALNRQLKKHLPSLNLRILFLYSHRNAIDKFSVWFQIPSLKSVASLPAALFPATQTAGVATPGLRGCITNAANLVEASTAQFNQYLTHTSLLHTTSTLKSPQPLVVPADHNQGLIQAVQPEIMFLGPAGLQSMYSNPLDAASGAQFATSVPTFLSATPEMQFQPIYAQPTFATVPAGVEWPQLRLPSWSWIVLFYPIFFLFSILNYFIVSNIDFISFVLHWAFFHRLI